jgi:hypothetical protein
MTKRLGTEPRVSFSVHPAFNALKRPVKVESSNMFAHRVSSHTPSTWKYWEHTAQYSSILPVENGPIDRHASSLSFDEAGAANLGYAIIAQESSTTRQKYASPTRSNLAGLANALQSFPA